MHRVPAAETQVGTKNKRRQHPGQLLLPVLTQLRLSFPQFPSYLPALPPYASLCRQTHPFIHCYLHSLPCSSFLSLLSYLAAYSLLHTITFPPPFLFLIYASSSYSSYSSFSPTCAESRPFLPLPRQVPSSLPSLCHYIIRTCSPYIPHCFPSLPPSLRLPPLYPGRRGQLFLFKPSSLRPHKVGHVTAT